MALQRLFWMTFDYNPSMKGNSKGAIRKEDIPKARNFLKKELRKEFKAARRKLRNIKEVQSAPKEVFTSLKEFQIQKSQILRKLPTNYGLHLIAPFRKSITTKTRL